MISTGSPGQQDAAQAVLYEAGGPRADTRLKIVILEAELSETPTDADDDRLRLHATLAEDYHVLAEYRQALRHGSQELALRRRIQGDNHPDTLAIRANTAVWTGGCGDAARGAYGLSIWFVIVVFDIVTY